MGRDISFTAGMGGGRTELFDSSVNKSLLTASLILYFYSVILLTASRREQCLNIHEQTILAVSLHVRHHKDRSYLRFVVVPTCHAYTFLCQCVIEAC